MPYAQPIPAPPPASAPPLDAYVTRREVCAALSLHHDTLRRWGIEGKLVPVVFTGQCLRYLRTDVETLIRESRFCRRKKPGPKPKPIARPVSAT